MLLMKPGHAFAQPPYFSPRRESLPENVSSETLTLEQEFEDHIFSSVDIDADCGFKDFLNPNESHPQQIRSHFDRAGKGVYVSTGTERSFFHLLHCDDKKCEGLVVLDINPRVKAYVDFNTLLIRISENEKEYKELSEISSLQELPGRVRQITNKIIYSQIPLSAKSYYICNINNFAKIYFKTEKNWRLSHSHVFKESRYDLETSKFEKIKRYADSGNIICITRDINNLSFLKNRKIAVVDTSNICDYQFLDLSYHENSTPLVVTTSKMIPHTTYFSNWYSQLNGDERKEYKSLLDKLHEAFEGAITSCNLKNIYTMERNYHGFKKDRYKDIGPYYSKESLKKLRDYVKSKVLEIPGRKPIHEGLGMLKELNEAKEHLTQCDPENVRNFLPSIVLFLQAIDANILSVFSTFEGWDEAIESALCQGNLPDLVDDLKEKNLFKDSDFIAIDGKIKLRKFHR